MESGVRDSGSIVEEDGGEFTGGDDWSLCEGVDCSGHGVCEVRNGAAVCICDAGYHSEGLECVEDCMPNAGTVCADGVTYWVDSCGNLLEVKEQCECGCNADSTGCKYPCECDPDCAGKECGPDGCGGVCPPGCGAGERCDQSTGLCECDPNCGDRDCGPDDCGGTCPPGCEGGEWCNNGYCQAFTSELVWVRIPGGTFMMGSETGDEDERPVHQVDVPAFEMTMTEVTVSQYRACVDASVCTQPVGDESNPFCNWWQPGRESHPVNCVDWEQAGTFCRWSGARLPSEAQWEYAARSAGRDIVYPWGDEPATCQYAVMNDHEAGGWGCGQSRTWVVCGKTAGNTAQGLCDMAGNVWEWVRDHYHESYVGAPTDGSAWDDLWFGDRVRRGGSFRVISYGVRASIRAPGDVPAGYECIFGIRCARLLEP